MARELRNIPQLIALTLAAAAPLATTGCWWTSTGCGDLEPSNTPIEVSDWTVDQDFYQRLLDEAEDYDGAPWEELDETQRCELACAVASDNRYAAAGYGYSSLELDSCELSIPTDTEDGLLNCVGNRVDTPICVGGRRPLAWTEPHRPVRSLRDELDGIATMEQVSITAFEELAAQLQRLGAPTPLVADCRAAAEDERRHVALVAGLGGRPPAELPDPAPAETSRLDIALHNATEGCVTETWAALLAAHQARHAPEDRTREVFARIAEDEGRHAQLAWELHAWLCEALSPAEARAVEDARGLALARLETLALEQALAVPDAVRQQLGLPGPREARDLARSFAGRLWAAA